MRSYHLDCPRCISILADIFALVKPNEDPNIRGDAFKTLIVARLSYGADERDLEREFGRYGPIERVRLPLLNRIG